MRMKQSRSNADTEFFSNKTKTFGDLLFFIINFGCLLTSDFFVSPFLFVINWINSTLYIYEIQQLLVLESNLASNSYVCFTHGIQVISQSLWQFNSLICLD